MKLIDVPPRCAGQLFIFKVIALAALLALPVFPQNAPAPTAPPRPVAGTKIVLIGGKKNHGVGQHDYPNGIPLLAAQLKASPVFDGAEILAFSTGWPEDPAALENVSTLLLYFNGVQQRPAPLLDPVRIAQVQKLMDAGAGLICLHQASTVPQDDASIPLVEWLGARRNGMFDRTTETVTLEPETSAHPVSAGIGACTLKDEFYPTLEFHPDARRIVPILRPQLTKPDGGKHTVAWAFERPNGGRSFGFTGGHFLANLEIPQIRKMLLNAIAWTAQLQVPPEGVATSRLVVPKAVVTRAAEARVLPQPWGELTWYTSAAQKNSQTMTTGLATIKPGQGNPRHLHPNCDEILHVIRGRIRHTVNEVTVEMNAGDTVSIPSGTLHNATNIGTEDALLAISFSTAYRQVVGE